MDVVKKTHFTIGLFFLFIVKCSLENQENDTSTARTAAFMNPSSKPLKKMTEEKRKEIKLQAAKILEKIETLMREQSILQSKQERVKEEYEKNRRKKRRERNSPKYEGFDNLIMADHTVKMISDLPTPCFLVDVNKVKKNASRMLEHCQKLGVQLRAHTKTHKTLEAANILSGGTKKCIVVSTLTEAELYADNGFDDILYGYPFTANKAKRCQQLFRKLRSFHVMIDTVYGLEALEMAPPGDGKRWSVYLEIDIAYHRTGVPCESDDVINLAKKMVTSDHVLFWGLYCHNGEAYHAKGAEQLRAIGKEGAAKLIALKDRLEKEGIQCTTLCLGSTPSCSHPDDSMSALTEFSPGNYVFYDLMQRNIGSCDLSDIAGRIATRIISHNKKHNHLIIDCGFLAISKDGMEENLPDGPWIIENQPNLRLTGMSQELGKVTAIDGNLDFTKYPVGMMLFIYPYHACATAAMHPEYYINSGPEIIDVWKPTRGW